MENVKCPCKWKSCKRHGWCDECISHHSCHPKHPLPFCKKQATPAAGAGKKAGSSANEAAE